QGRRALSAEGVAQLPCPLRRGQPPSLLQALRVRGHGELRPHPLRHAAFAAAAAPLRGQDPRPQRGAGPSTLARRGLMDAQPGRALGRLLGLRRPYPLIDRRFRQEIMWYLKKMWLDQEPGIEAVVIHYTFTPP